MANLKGSSFEKQIRDARIRTDARGQKKAELQNKNFARSHVIVNTRESQLNDFATFLQNQGIHEGKLNQHFTEKNLQSFFKERISALSSSSANTYISGFNGLLKGLKNANISIKVEHDAIAKSFTKELQKQSKEQPIKTGRYISKSEFQQNIQKLPSHMQPIARLQYQHGFRVEEALKIVRNPEKHIQNSKIGGVQGKGGRIYKQKRISQAMKKDLQRALKIGKSTYQKAVNKAFKTFNHNFRLSYAVNKVEELKREGMSQIAAQRATSEEMNHSREETTRYYQIRA